MGAFLTYVPPPQAVVINYDIGGIVAQYEDMVSTYSKENRRVEIRGLCSSACTLALTIPNTCVSKGATVAWHQAYETYTHEIRPEVTDKMLENLPVRLKEYLKGRIKKEYGPDTILHYEQLVVLGVASCDDPLYQNNTVTAKVNYSTPVSKPQPATVIPAPQPNNNKNAEWASYWTWAIGQSRLQFGEPVTAKYCYGEKGCSKTVYYYDRHHQYVSAVEYYKDGKVSDRQVCRSSGSDTNTMLCVGWHDERKTTYVKNQSNGQYVEANGK